MTSAEGAGDDTTTWPIPKSWHWTEVGEVGRVALGRQRSPINHQGPFMRPYLRAANVTWGGLDLTDVKEMNFDEADFERFELRVGDVLLNEGSGSPTEVGKPAIWMGEIEGCCFQNTLLRVQPTGCTPEFALAYFRFCALTGRFAPASQGVNIAHIGKEGLAKFPIAIPPFAEQRRIVAKLDALTARTARARADLDRVPALAARYKQAVLDEAFTGRLTAGWRRENGQPCISAILTEVRAARKGDRKLSRRAVAQGSVGAALPSTWGWISPDELAADTPYAVGIGPFGSNLLQSDYRGSGTRLIFVRDIRRERFGADGARYITAKKAAELHQHMIFGGEVLITKMGAPPGDTALYPAAAGEAVITSDCVKLKPHDQLAMAEFLVYAMRTSVVRDQLAEITAGVAQQKISLQRFRSMALPVAPLAEQRELIRLIRRSFAEIDRLTAEAAAARRLLDRLDQEILAKAFRGELVPQDPADEPASALLERIKAHRVNAAKPARGRPRRAA